MNSGKVFESDFKKSVPPNIYYYRLRDGTASWSGGETRFQATNDYDCSLFDGDVLVTCELKSVKGKSIPFSNIKKNQIDGLRKACEFRNVISVIIINFRETNQTYAIPIIALTGFMNLTTKKSINITDCESLGVAIESTLKRTRSSYDIREMIDNLKVYDGI